MRESLKIRGFPKQGGQALAFVEIPGEAMAWRLDSIPLSLDGLAHPQERDQKVWWC